MIVYDTKFSYTLDGSISDKGSALKMITTDLGIKMDKILAIGDSENDIEFFNSNGC